MILFISLLCLSAEAAQTAGGLAAYMLEVFT